MKTTKPIIAPNTFYELFGIYVSGSDCQDNEISSPDCSLNFLSGTGRVVTLAKESRYKSYLPMLKKVDLLSLNYPSLPQDPVLKTEAVRRIIKAHTKKSLLSVSPCKELDNSTLRFVERFFVLSPDSVSVDICRQNDNPMSNLACCALKTTEAIRITFHKLNGVTMYANPFSSRKFKSGYYHWKDNHSIEALVINLDEFLTDAALMNSLYEAYCGTQIPLIQNVYKRFAESIREHHSNETAGHVILKFIESGNPLPYESLFHSIQTQNETKIRPGMTALLSSKLYQLFCSVLEISADICHETSCREKLVMNIATAYMTKKNIPDRIQNAMKSSSFMNYFKYVEFDEDVDLESINAIEKEFISINETFFSKCAFRDVKIRFRKLGKHKASGLYYPSLNTLCVDIRSPSSFIHEYFHMIDDQLGDLSLGVEFQEIVEEYRKAFLLRLKKESSAVQEQMNGNSKYNIRYFFRRAEIFARCGEIYMVRIVRAESSLLKPDLEFAYPESDALDISIKDYFDDLLQNQLAHSSFSKAC